MMTRTNPSKPIQTSPSSRRLRRASQAEHHDSPTLSADRPDEFTHQAIAGILGGLGGDTSTGRVIRARTLRGLAATTTLGAIVLTLVAGVTSAAQARVDRPLLTPSSLPGTGVVNGPLPSWLPAKPGTPAEPRLLPHVAVQPDLPPVPPIVLPPGTPPPGSTVPVYPVQGGTWGRSGKFFTYRLTGPRMGSVPGPKRHGVMAWQELLAEQGYHVPRHGRYDRATARAVKLFQWRKRLGVPRERMGQMNITTARALLGPTIRREALRVGMDPGLLCGHIMAESVLDAGTVGPNGMDLGIAQISTPFHLAMTEDQLFDEDFAIRYMAERDAKAFRRFGDWSYAVVSYNSPLRAKLWHDTGVPSELALRYYTRIMLGCGPADTTVTVERGQHSWSALAVRYLGDGRRGVDIAAATGADPARQPRPGQVVRLPKP